MAKLERLTNKVFGAGASSLGDNPEIGQFGSAKNGSYIGTGDVAEIQSLEAWTNGWIDAVTPDEQFPTLPEMTAVHKVLSHQTGYLLQEGIAEYDENTVYYKGSIVKIYSDELRLFVSITDNNQGNEVTNKTYWNEIPLTGIYHPPLLSFQWCDHLINDIQWLRAETFSWQSGVVYETVYEKLVAEYNDEQSEEAQDGEIVYKITPSGYKITTAEYENDVFNYYLNNNKGWYYILDEENTRFKLPRDNHGELIEKGVVPNGNFKIHYRVYSDGYCEQWGNGVEIVDTPLAKQYINTDYSCVVSFAYRETSDYSISVGERTTSSFKVFIHGDYTGNGEFNWITTGYINTNATNSHKYLYFYVGEYNRTALEQTAGITSEELNAKVDLDGNNATFAHIIESYVNGYSGYVIWSNGYCEQWGFNPATAQDRTPYTLTLLKTYKDTNYHFIRVPKGCGRDFNLLYAFGATNIDGKHVEFYTSNTYYYTGDNWLARGYLAEGEY